MIRDRIAPAFEPRGFDPNKFNREMRAAQRKAEAAMKREVAKAEPEINRRAQQAARTGGRS
jgi:hypothetical protein